MNSIRVLMIFTIVFHVGCSVVGIRTAEELKYTVLEEDEAFEIRKYAPYLSAEASTTGEAKEVQSPLFRILAGYIFGKNTTEESISMTAPVVLNPEEPAPVENSKSEDIAMTAPVIMEESAQGTWKMAFSMPAEYTMSTIPKPLDDRISLIEVPSRTLAVIQYSGSFNDLEERASMEKALVEWIARNPGYQAMGEPFYAGYDPPFTLPFLRRNEVLIEVEAILEETP